MSLLLAILVALLTLSQSPIFAETNNSLDEVQGEIADRQNKITGFKDQERALLSDFVALESQLQKNRQELGTLQKKLATTRCELHKIQVSFRDKQEDLKQKKSILRTRVTHIYTESRFIDFDFFLSCKDIATLLSRIDYLNMIAKQDVTLVQKVTSEKEHLEQVEGRMEQEKRSLLTLESNCRAKEAELDKKKDEKAELLNEARAQQSETEESLKDLRNQAVQIGTEMNKLQPPSRGTARGSLRMLATGYCPCSNCCGSHTGRTATGLPAGKGVVAVDPKVIPLGTKLYISEYGEAIAGDIGGNIVGNRIDLGFDAHSQTSTWGKRWVVVDILE